ncbi:MAG: hypothetical protein ACI9YM_002166 [Brevundimonas sp.]|jgi:hypothetical protein|uniref:hypothetical protein n=1 Tax=Brevundimonas sp. TaxID=1871086 RepID=UPI0024879AC3|nr:hypothetical protein [Brevundimonas sp.]MDI1281450.1 hypothetical protein [Brevundimonas sp.]
MRRSPAALIALLLAGCAATAPMPDPAGPVVGSGDDCAVIAAVAREHYGFNSTDTLPPPLWLDDEGRAWAPRCDWARYGLSFPEIHDPARTPPSGQPLRWVQFKQPRYDGQGALVDSAIMHGPLAGNGIQCRVRSGFAGWTVSDCRITWVN